LDSFQSEIDSLRVLVRDLASRVERLEERLAELNGAPTLPSARATSPVSHSIPVRPSSPAAKVEAPAPPVRPVAIPPAVTQAPSDIDLESRIGSHWLNRIGITAVLIGVSYFLKFAFDSNWIGPAGRVAIGLVSGIAVVTWSERFRLRDYRVFSYSLKAVGIGAIYLSLWAAFQVYRLLPSGVAFAAMFMVTASTTLLAVTQDAEVLAAFALTGGFVTPLLLSTGENREIALFAYVILLDLATLVLAARKPWRRLLLLSYAGTLVLYVGWYSSFYDRSQAPVTITFATIFFVIFALAPLLAAHPKDQAPAWGALPLFLALANAAVYFFQIYDMVEVPDRPLMAWFALGLAAAYIGLSRLSQARYAGIEGTDRLRFLHLALAIGFVTVAIPIRLEGHWITMGWFVEAGVLLWVGRRISSDFLNLFAIGALALGVLRLLMIDNFVTSNLVFNSRMATYVVAIAVLGVVIWFGRERADDRGRLAIAVASIAANGLALYALSQEVSDYYARALASLPRTANPWDIARTMTWRSLHIAESFSYSALWMVYGALLMAVGFCRRSAFVRWQALVLIAVTIGKVFVYDVWELDRGYRVVSFTVLGVLLLAISFAYQRDWLKLSKRRNAAETQTTE
jgi:uncharacterized membrane protein